MRWWIPCLVVACSAGPSAKPGMALTSVGFEDYDMLECGPVTNNAATCKLFDPIGFAATYTIHVESGRAYVVEIEAQSWGHS